MHPAEAEPAHELYLKCDDIEQVLAGCPAEGGEVVTPVSDQGWGLLASIRLPSGTPLPIYQPRHPSPSISDHSSGAAGAEPWAGPLRSGIASSAPSTVISAVTRKTSL
ncbi:hypothetical protein GCM10023320_54100 [Pseudonocardia adelaidensis]|uniref:VOC domain-containing protein n=1 Tax=Pseudonocardia adelaidensis TaxID=648754 RepID=A0ABP9NQN6_9PSEU